MNGSRQPGTATRPDPLHASFGTAFRDLTQNLRRGARLRFGGRLRAATISLRLRAQLVRFAVLQLLLILAVSVAVNGPDGCMDWEALPATAFPAPALLAEACLRRHSLGHDAVALELPIVLLAPAPCRPVFLILEELLAQAGVFDDGLVSDRVRLLRLPRVGTGSSSSRR